MTKGPILQKIWDRLPEERKTRIQERAKKKIAEYHILQQFRKEVGLTLGNAR